MVPIANLGRPELSLHWHEAVAIVAETGAVLRGRRVSGVPSAASIILAPDGTLHVPDGGAPDPAPARRLGAMLDALLSSTACPPELRRLTADSMADPPAYATLEAFTDALAFFERPGRDALLKDVAARASEMALEARAETELERLEARARNQPSAAERRVEPRRPHARRAALFIAASVVIVGALGGALLALLGPRQASATTITEHVRTRVGQITQKGLEAIGVRVPAPTLPAPAPAVAAVPKRTTPRNSRREPREVSGTISVRAFAGGSLSTLPSLGTPTSPEPITPDDNVYTAGEEGVEPAVLTRPHLPSEPPANVAPEEVGILEIVVSPTGAVEHVRLVSTANRYEDRMIVAAVKAWRFEPATKDGHPVRYRTRIRVTL